MWIWEVNGFGYTSIRTGGGANGIGSGMGEKHAFVQQFADVRHGSGVLVVFVKTEVVRAQIVSDDEDDVVLRHGCRRKQEEKGKQGNGFLHCLVLEKCEVDR